MLKNTPPIFGQSKVSSLMNRDNIKIGFWCLFAVQAAGTAVILWVGLPVYRCLLSDQREVATPDTFGSACIAIVVMQLAYWLAFRIQPTLRFRRNVVLAHVLLWLGELSYFFPHALAAVCLLDRFQELEKTSFLPERLVMLASLLFAVYCFKHQLETVAEAMSESESRMGDSNTKQIPDSLLNRK